MGWLGFEIGQVCKSWCEMHDDSIKTLYLRSFTDLQLLFEGHHYTKFKQVHTVEVDGSRDDSPIFTSRDVDTDARGVRHIQLLDKLVSNLPALTSLHFVYKDVVGVKAVELVQSWSRAPMLSSLSLSFAGGCFGLYGSRDWGYLEILQNMSSMNELTHLHVSGLKVTPDGIAVLGSISTLTHLNLAGKVKRK